MSIPDRPRAVITGASSGLGRAFAVELASRRANILIADIDEAGAAETARLVERAGGKAEWKRCDVRNRDEVTGLLAEADRALGGADVLINNAGVAVSGLVEDIPLDDWSWIVSINLMAVVYGCHAFIPRFKQQGSGSILNVASAAGLISAPKMGPYCMTKAGVVALSETLHLELTPHKIGVTVLCPTFFRTNIVSSGRSYGIAEERPMAEKAMDRATLQADGVARFALKTLDAGRLYAVPHQDGRWGWRMKRANPELFHQKIIPEFVRRRRA